MQEYFDGKQSSDKAAFDDWVSGFYFNSGIQRIVWAGERLLLTFASIERSCGGRPMESAVSTARPRFPAILQGAEERLDHIVKDNGHALVETRNGRGQFVPEYERGQPLDSRVLAMLRYDVNNRKHKVYGRSRLLDRASAGQGDNKMWSTTGADLTDGVGV